MHIIWKPHHSYNPRSTSIDGELINLATGEKRQLDFECYHNFSACPLLAMTAPDIGPMPRLDGEAYVVQPREPYSVHIVLIPDPFAIMDFLHNIGVMMG